MTFPARPLRIAFALALAGSVVGCDTLSNFNPFKEKEVPLEGERRPVPRVAPPPADTVPQPLSLLPSDASASIA